MNRLQTELQRLYLPHDATAAAPLASGTEPDLLGADGRVRALVVEVARSAGLDGLTALWRGLQDDLDLPAPALAVSGDDGFQLWLSLAEPIPVALAQGFLESLCQRYLGEIMPQHIDVKPVVDASAPRQARHARLVPALQASSGHWSAFVAPGLASMFANEPWLDLPPGDDAQAKLLAELQSIQPADFQRAQQQLRADNAAPTPVPVSPGISADQPADRLLAAQHDTSTPKRFLLSVMQDPGVELHLRIEAAKALLPHFE